MVSYAALGRAGLRSCGHGHGQQAHHEAVHLGPLRGAYDSLEAWELVAIT